MDESGVMELLDELSDEIEQSKVPIGRNTLRTIDYGVVRDLLDRILDVFPVQFDEARKTVLARQEIIADAKVEAARIVEDAKLQALTIVGEQEVVRMAKLESESILQDAYERDRIQRLESDEYVERLFNSVLTELNKATDNLSRARESLNSRSSGR